MDRPDPNQLAAPAGTQLAWPEILDHLDGEAIGAEGETPGEAAQACGWEVVLVAPGGVVARDGELQHVVVLHRGRPWLLPPSQRVT